MKTTIEMAREAWAEAGEGWVADAWFDDRAKAFEAFAKLVRADEREGTSMTKYEEQIRGMAQQNRGSVGMQEARPQPEQEPVACKTLCELCVKRGYTFCANAVKTTPIPTPPQRTWVGLTDDELSAFDLDPVEANAMIAKLKEKNGG